ncbi:MAG: hypothetical protein OJF62_001918 [Pseudolabrys sp.]|nr:hypothetical protein [Pseudolabrys sp.]
MFDMNDAEPQKTGELIPDGTFAKVTMIVRPGGIDGQSEIDQALLKAPSLGCGDDKYIVSRAEITKGGLWHWKRIIEAAMRLQSLAATNQVRLLLGPPSVIRLDAPIFEPKIPMDDWQRSVAEFVPAADAAIIRQGEQIAAMFLKDTAAPFVPISSAVG